MTDLAERIRDKVRRDLGVTLSPELAEALADIRREMNRRMISDSDAPTDTSPGLEGLFDRADQA